MDEKDVKEIASAVSGAIAKLNADTIAAEGNSIEKEKTSYLFKCPECNGEVTGGIKFCPHCGCELEWAD